MSGGEFVVVADQHMKEVAGKLEKGAANHGNEEGVPGPDEANGDSPHQDQIEGCGQAHGIHDNQGYDVVALTSDDADQGQNAEEDVQNEA